MIKYTKIVNYYNKEQFIESQEIDKKSFYDVDDALKYANRQDLKYYNNKKSYSLNEEIAIVVKNDDGFKKYYKIIDKNGFITTNIKD